MAKTFDEICSEILKEMSNNGQQTTNNPDLSTSPQNPAQKNPASPSSTAPSAQQGTPATSNPQAPAGQQTQQQTTPTQAPKVAYTSTKNNADMNALLQQMQQMAQNNEDFKKQMLQALGVK